MSNLIATMDAVSKEVLYLFDYHNVARKTMNTQYDSTPSYLNTGAGDTIKIKRPQRFIALSSLDLSAVDANTKEETASLVKGTTRTVPLQFGSKELAQDLAADAGSMAMFSRAYLSSAIQTISASVDKAVFDNVLTNVVGDVVSSGTALALETLARAKTALTELGCPTGERSLVLSTELYPALLPVIASLMVPVGVNADYREGEVTPVMGFQVYESVSLTSHSLGTWFGTATTPKTGAAPSEGGSTLNIIDTSSSGTATIKTGDKFTIAGCYAVNPVTSQALSSLKVFTAAEDITVTAKAADTLLITEKLYASTSDSRRNVSVLPTSGSSIAATNKGTIQYRGVAYHRDAFVFATQDLPLLEGYTGYLIKDPDPNSGLSMRLTMGSDILKSTHTSRLDILFGSASVIPEWATFVSQKNS